MHPYVNLEWRILILALGLLEICGACSLYWVTGPAGLYNKILTYNPVQDLNYSIQS